MKASLIGCGWVTPAGKDPDQLRAALAENRRPAVERLENPLNQKNSAVYRVPPESVSEAACLPRLRRSSAISHFAVAAAVQAAADAGLDEEMLARTALVFAASDGGVVYTRRFYADIVERGEGSGSPLLFPETVYNAPASHIAARLGLAKETITLVGDAAAGITAIQTGCEILASGQADFCLIAAAQELDWITCDAYGRWGLAGDGNSGAIFSEGAAALVLGKKEAASSVANIHPGFSFTTEKEAADFLGEIVRDLCCDARPDIAVSSASGTRLGRLERQILTRALPDTPLIEPKLVLGEALACSTLQQVITARLTLRERPAGRALVTSLGFNGAVSGLILTQEEAP